MKLTHTFTINHIDNQDVHRVGTFTCKKRSIQDNARLGVRITQLNGGMHYDADKPGYGIDENTYALNYMIACLELGLTQKPEWFNIDELVDMELLELVYKEVADFEATFRRNNRKVDNTSSSARGSEEKAEAHGSRENPKMVVPQISASLEP